MVIRSEQMREFETRARESFLRRVVGELRAKYPERLPASDSELRISTAGWIDDARRWGFKTDASIIRYVMCCAESQGQREPIEVRLPVYLALYHQTLLEGVDLHAFVPSVIRLASKQNIREDEGIAWLSVILLAGLQRGETDTTWVGAALSQSNDEEEKRLLKVHQQAAARGWFSPRRTTDV